MKNSVANFIRKAIKTHASGHAREHSYRPELKELFENVTGLKVVNEPKRSEYGAPDFVFLKGKIVIAYAEAKDINVSLVEIEKSEQMNRYYGYSNIILTNGLEFRFYRNASRYTEPIIIGKLHGSTIESYEASFQLLGDTIKDFITESKEPIKSGSVLAKVMAGKARRIRDNVKRFFTDEHSTQNENLLSVYEVIKKLLLADLDKTKFADMYAQTLVYGLFVARYYDTSKDTFSRQEARDLVPASNPFLRHFFDHITGSSFDPRIEMIVNELCEEFTHADVQAIIHNYYKIEKDNSRDPIIHFYEDFLQEYDPIERKKMGVFYTPLPVVHFIIRSVDDILKKEFNLPQGLADSSKIEIVRDVQGKKHKVPVHRVQVLDPATGTGTFLNEAILHIKKSFEGQEGRWSQYVNTDLLPRLHGFELMMASYTIAHLKLSSTIHESGAEIENTRLGVYLTNSLEKGEDAGQTLFSTIGLGKAITEESIEANKVKNELPIMVVMGNPPYSVSSQNKGEWIQDLIKDYKKNLGERKINLDDDYIKFIRFAEHLIEKNGNGIVAMITNNSFIDGITHRQMRKHLLETFDSIYILDLHGNSKKKESAPDSGKDENVFAIQQGVSISLFVKKEGKKKDLAKVCHADLYGKQKSKFEKLDNGSLENIKWQKLDYKEPYYFFVPKDFEASEEYESGFKIDELFPHYNSGIQTKNDTLSVHFTESELDRVLKDFQQLNAEEVKTKYFLKNTSGWNIEKAMNSLSKKFYKTRVAYRPFDIRTSILQSESGGFIGRSRFDTSKYFLEENIGLLSSRSIPPNQNWDRTFVTIFPADIHSASDQTYMFPLWIYEKGKIGASGTVEFERQPNFQLSIARKIAECVGMNYYPIAEYETIPPDERLTPEDIFDYIYAALHSPSYREKYKEFLKIDFPRVPYPKDVESFKKLVAFGRELRELHLLESPKINKFITTYPITGSNVVEKIFYKDEKVFINAEQYFGNVPEIAWNFYIGGYQPAQKWLKDRKGRALTNSDIEHYQKMIVALNETDRIMKKITEIK